MTCPPDDEIAAFVEGRLSEPEMRVVREHFNTCTVCADLVADYARAWSMGLSTERTPVEEQLEFPAQLGRYRLLSPLGEGGLGVVYEAQDPELDRRVAIKLIRLDRDMVETARVRREAEALARVSHPNIVSIYDVGTWQPGGHGTSVYIVMELIEGTPLDRWLHHKTPSWTEVLDVFEDAARGLVAAHQVGIIHRDFKPANVMLSRGGQAKVVDFGLAKLGPGTTLVAEQTPSIERSESSHLTETGTVMGTRAYMAPEQFLGEADEHSDQFSFCVALYQALCGFRPFTGNNVAEIYGNITRERIAPPPSGSPVPRRIHDIVRKGLRPDPSQRWGSMSELVTELERSRVRSTKRWITVAGGLALVALLSVSPGDDGDDPCSDSAQGLGDAWNEELAGELSRGFGATALSHAAGSWSEAQRGIDTYAARWRSTRNQLCSEATAATTGRLEAGLVCLRQRREDLEAAIDILRKPSPGVVRHAAGIVDALADPQSCASASSSLVVSERAADPARTRQIDSLRQETEAARLSSKAGQLDVALIQIEDAVGRARDLGHASQLAMSLAVYGDVLHSTGQYERAEQILQEAFFVAEEIGHDEVALDTATLLLIVVGRELARPEDGEFWLRHAEAVVGRGMVNPAARAYLVGAEAMFVAGQARHEEALPLYRRTLELLQETLPEDHLRVLEARQNIALQLRWMGRYAEAEAEYRDVLAEYEATLGDHHPHRGHLLHLLGTAVSLQGRNDEAEALYLQALAIGEAALGKGHPDVIQTYNNLGTMAHRQGKFSRAHQYFEVVLDSDERQLGPDHPIHVGTLNNLGSAALELGNMDEAEAALVRALAIAEANFSEEDPRRARTQMNLAGVHFERGDRQRGLAVYEAGLQRFIAAWGAQNPTVATARRRFGNMLLDSGDARRASEELEAALWVLEASDTDRAVTEDARTDLARALAAQRSGAGGGGRAGAAD